MRKPAVEFRLIDRILDMCPHRPFLPTIGHRYDHVIGQCHQLVSEAARILDMLQNLQAGRHIIASIGFPLEKIGLDRPDATAR